MLVLTILHALELVRISQRVLKGWTVLGILREAELLVGGKRPGALAA